MLPLAEDSQTKQNIVINRMKAGTHREREKRETKRQRKMTGRENQEVDR